MQLNAPNVLSLSRLALAGCFVLARTPALQAAIVLVAASTDFIDGWIARRFGQRSKAGEVLDPITDKLFVLTVLVTLLVRGLISPAQLLLLLTRDLFNTIAFTVAKARKWPVQFKSRMSGKIVTSLQIATVVAVLVVPGLTTPVLWLTFAAALVAIFDYSRAGV